MQTTSGRTLRLVHRTTERSPRWRRERGAPLLHWVADGDVRLSLHVVEGEPRLDDSWEDCVEVCFSPLTPVVALFDWDGAAEFEIALGRDTYRVRYAARGMDAGASGTETEVCALWFWPAPTEPDAIVKQTSESAAGWHTVIAREN